MAWSRQACVVVGALVFGTGTALAASTLPAGARGASEMAAVDSTTATTATTTAPGTVTGPTPTGTVPPPITVTAPTTTASPRPSPHRLGLPAYPPRGRIAAAVRFLDTRAGHTALAVLDSHGRLRGVRDYQTFYTASVVKAMMLVAYLQMLAREHRKLDSASRSVLGPMIRVSDNGAASAVFAVVGPLGLDHVARQAGMKSFANGVGWWAYSLTSAADQARFFARQDQLIPPQFDGYARSLFSSVIAWQTWGVRAIARPLFHVYCKSGSLPSRALTHIVARFERPGYTFTAVILTDDEPSTEYGTATVDGVVRDLLGKG